KALMILQQLTASDPANTDWQRQVLATVNCIGEIVPKQGNGDEALQMYTGARANAETIAANDPENFEWHGDLAPCQKQLRQSYIDSNGLDDASAECDNASAILNDLFAIDSSNAKLQRDLALVKHQQGLVLQKKGNEAAARASYRAAVERMQEAVKMSPGNK